MLKELKNINSFTLLEVLVATLVFALAVAGILATISSLSRPAGESSREVAATFLGKKILDELRLEVDPESWVNATGNLFVGTHDLSPVTLTTETTSTTYDRTYIVTDEGDGTKKVVVQITWKE